MNSYDKIIESIKPRLTDEQLSDLEYIGVSAIEHLLTDAERKELERAWWNDYVRYVDGFAAEIDGGGAYY